MHVISGQENPKIRGGCRVGTACEPVGSWCFMRVQAPERLLWGKPSFPPFVRGAGSLPHGHSSCSGVPWIPPSAVRSRAVGAGSWEEGVSTWINGHTAEMFFSLLSVLFFCGSVCSLFHLWAKGSIWQCAVHLVATYCEIIMQANLAPSWIS